MSAGDDGPTVTTNGGTHSIVAGIVHGGVRNNYYQVPRDAAPAARLAYARRCLDSGQVTTARSVLADVAARQPHSTKAMFYWLLAFFSGRTLSELSAQDRDMLAQALHRIDGLPRNRWSSGIEVVRRLVAASEQQVPAKAALGDIDALGDDRRAEVLRHLDRVLQGSLKDDLWKSECEEARVGQRSERRQDRVWMFFEPDPAPPRTRPVRQPDLSAAGLTVFLAVIAAGAAGTLGWLALQRNDSSAVIALAAAVVAAGVALTNGAEWQFRVDALRAEARHRRTSELPVRAGRPGGFVSQVDDYYVQYARRLAPKGPNRDGWLGSVQAPMARLRHEVCEVYREAGIGADRIKWLVRFQVRELRRQWDSGELTERRHRVRAAVKVSTTAGTVVVASCLLWAVQAAGRQNLLQTAAAVVALTAAGTIGVRLGLGIGAESRRFAAEEAERQQRNTSYRAEFRRWQQRLSDRPDDMQMGKWLDCDRRLLVQRVLAAYQLKWSDIRAYASMEAPADRSKRARAKNGPWRYSRYRMLVFLLTADGVRQITVELDFAKVTLHLWERTNYRYDAVAAVRVSLSDDGAREFRLFLVNGAAIQVEVTEPWKADADEDPQVIADGEQDASGLRNTLFVLEGVAAEGRSWWAGPAYRRAG